MHFDGTQSWVIYLGSILVASLSGSLHCVAMCGGLAIQAKKPMAYHGFRLLGYWVFTALGSLGLQSLIGTRIHAVATVLMSALLIYFGVEFFRNKKSFEKYLSGLSRLSAFGLRFGLRQENTLLQSSLLGFFTAFLPCGWFYTFLLLALNLGSLLKAMSLIFVFWVGSLPLLVSSSTGLRSLFPRFNQKVVASILVLTGIFSLSLHLWPGGEHGGHHPDHPSYPGHSGADLHSH